jgi:lipoprotein-anchoring transpeptidase ErfK/SrfK
MNALIAVSSSMDGSAGGLDVTALSALPDTLDQLAGGLDAISTALTDLNDAFSPAYAALDAAIGEIPDSEVSQTALAALYQNNPDQKDALDELAAYYAAAVKVKATYGTVKAAFDAVGARWASRPARWIRSPRRSRPYPSSFGRRSARTTRWR